MNNPFEKFFQPAERRVVPLREPIDQEVRAECNDWLIAARSDFWKRLMEYLEKEADSPVKPSPDLIDMVGGLARQNTMKEVRDYLRKKVATSQATLDSHREVEDE